MKRRGARAATSRRYRHLSANDYLDQYVGMVPERDLVLVRLENVAPEQRAQVPISLASLVRSFPNLWGQ